MAYITDASRHLGATKVDADHPLIYPSPTRARRRAVARPYNIAWLSASNEVHYDTIVAPSLPVIEGACANMARGALVSTVDGPVAIEDLTPGTMVITPEYGPLPVQWIGSFMMSMREALTADRGALFRVAADTFGLSKPSQDLLLAPRAHILFNHAKCRRLFGVDKALAPVRAFEDGVSVFSVQPVSPIEVFNLSFDRQATVIANGLELESFHPGPYAETLIDDDTLNALLRLLPMAKTLDFFGPQQVNRLTTFEVNALREGL